MNVLNTIVGTGRKVYTAIKPHIPTIMVIGGSIAVCGGAFCACKATLKVDEVIEEHNAMMEHIAVSVEKVKTNPYITYTDSDMRHDKLQVYSMTAGKLFKLYGPGIGLAVAGFASIFYGFGLIKHWHALAVSAASALDERFANYRANVIDEYGVDADRRFAGEAIEKKTVEYTVIDENGNKEKRTGEVIDLGDATANDFSFIFDWHSGNKWETGYLYNDNWIVSVQEWYTKRLQSNAIDHVFANTIFKEFDAQETGQGHFYGITNKPGAHLFLNAQPFVRMFNDEDDSQIPMEILLPVTYTPRGDFMFINEEDERLWKQTYAENDHNVGYILTVNVDTDENGIPRSIYDDVYGHKK